MHGKNGNNGGDWGRGDRGRGDARGRGGNAGHAFRGAAGRGGSAGGQGRGFAGAPTAPVAMRGGLGRGRGGLARQAGQTGQGAGRGSGFGQGHGTQGQPSPMRSVVPTVMSTKPLDPARFKAPEGQYVDQTQMESVGAAARFNHCLHCGQEKGPRHPDWEDCLYNCGWCGSKGHRGQACPQLYCSEKWWKDRNQNTVPENIQLRPSGPQQVRLREMDPYFIDFPPEIHPQHHLHNLQQGAEESQLPPLAVSKKRKLDGTAELAAMEEANKRLREIVREKEQEVMEHKKKNARMQNQIADLESAVHEYVTDCDRMGRSMAQLHEIVEQHKTETRTREEAAVGRRDAFWQQSMLNMLEEIKMEMQRQVQAAERRGEQRGAKSSGSNVDETEIKESVAANEPTQETGEDTPMDNATESSKDLQDEDLDIDIHGDGS